MAELFGKEQYEEEEHAGQIPQSLLLWPLNVVAGCEQATVGTCVCPRVQN